MKTLLTILLSLVASAALAQTAILSPSQNYLCGQVGTATFCGGSTPQDGFTIMPLGKDVYTVTPMAPTMPSYPSLSDEPKQPRESSTPLFLDPSQGSSVRSFESEQSKNDMPCLKLFSPC